MDDQTELTHIKFFGHILLIGNKPKLCVTKPVSLAASILAQEFLMWSAHLVKDGSRHGLNMIFSLSKAALPPLLSVSQVSSPHWIPSLMEGITICLYRKLNLFWIWISLSVYNMSPIPLFVNFKNTFFIAL